MQREELFPRIRMRVAELLNGYFGNFLKSFLLSWESGRVYSARWPWPTAFHTAAKFHVTTVVMALVSERYYLRRSLGDLCRGCDCVDCSLIAGPKGDRMDANELAVVRELQLINTMQTQYKSRFQRFAATLAELGPPPSGEPGPQAADLIPAALASGDKDGYRFLMAATISGYTVNANPKVFERSGYRTFYTDQNGIIRGTRTPNIPNARSPEFK